jgi:multiple sugar transport system permease protein
MTRAERLVPYIFLLPALLLVLVFNIFPAIATIAESLFINALNQEAGRSFVGLANFQRIFNDPIFWKSLSVTLVFSLFINPIQTILALGLAVLANQRMRGISVFRSIYLLPVAVSLNVTAIVWGLMLDRNAGLVNGFLASAGLPRQAFFSSTSQALGSVIGVASWTGVPFWMLFFLAGLQGIPHTLIEAAAIDGANRWQTFTRITLPLLRRVFAFVLVADTIANFVLFVPIYLLTQGGPQLSTNLIMFETYRRGFVYGDLGAAAAMLSVILAIVLIVVVLELLLLRSRT